MHPDCRYDERLEYSRSRTTRKRGQLELLRPALMALLSILASDRRRRELAEFAVWAIETSRQTLAGNLSVRQRTEMQRDLEYAHALHNLTAQAPPTAALRQASSSIEG